jgi:hypothetical protein
MATCCSDQANFNSTMQTVTIPFAVGEQAVQFKVWSACHHQLVAASSVVYQHFLLSVTTLTSILFASQVAYHSSADRISVRFDAQGDGALDYFAITNQTRPAFVLAGKLQSTLRHPRS